jgi:hypothetical protein
VTFNYDELLELAWADTLLNYPLRDGTDKLDSYVAMTEYKLFKLHGSIDWRHPTRESVQNVGPDAMPRLLAEMAIDTLDVSDEFIRSWNPMTSPDSAGVVRGLYPAIAIPVGGAKRFECPPAHVEMLVRLLPETSRVLVIGWRGAETHFLELLRQLLPAGLPVDVIGTEHVDEAVLNLTTAQVAGEFASYNRGFTSYIRECRLVGALWTPGEGTLLTTRIESA